MLVLGLESSCDETAASVVEDGVVLSGVVRSQVDLHCQYGGVVPEIASRAHLEAVDLISRQALAEAGRDFRQLDGLAVTQGPGLVGALLVALSFAKGLSMATGLPLTGVNHLKAHALAPFLRPAGSSPAPEPHFPLVALVVSGGHTNLYRMDDYLSFSHLGRTRDDAAGEAFDKTAKLMGLGYPGGRVIEELARRGNPEAFQLARPMLKDIKPLSGRVESPVSEATSASGPDRGKGGKPTRPLPGRVASPVSEATSASGPDRGLPGRAESAASEAASAKGPDWGLDFSFSGLKTQVLTIYRDGGLAGLPAEDSKLADLAASFQAAVVEVLTAKLSAACRLVGARGAVLAGGVAANGALRAAAAEALRKLGLDLYVPPPAWCADNAAMIAGLGERQLARGENLLNLSAEAYPRWPVS